MKTFKLRTGNNKIHTIQKDIFEYETQQQPPYYVYGEKNELSQYAVCPACDNPIQIIGLYKPIKDGRSCYGKHHLNSISGLAVYNQQAYDYCPYSRNRFDVNENSRKERLTDYERKIYDLMREQFDRVIYVLSKAIDIKILPSAARRMLETYVNGHGWLYSWSTLNNLPYVLGHLTWSKTLYGQPVLRNSHLYEAIKLKCPSVEFTPHNYYNDYDIITKKENGAYIDLNYCIINHKRNIIDDQNVETMQLLVTNGHGDNAEIVFQKQLEIDEAYFLNLINLPKDRSYRNETLINISAELMQPLI